MSKLGSNQDAEFHLAGDDSRAVYEKPELVDMGPVADLTKSGAAGSGAEGSYS